MGAGTLYATTCGTTFVWTACEVDAGASPSTFVSNGDDRSGVGAKTETLGAANEQANKANRITIDFIFFVSKFN